MDDDDYDDDDDDDDCLAFWHRYKSTAWHSGIDTNLVSTNWPALSVPAASSAVERILAKVVLFDTSPRTNF